MLPSGRIGVEVEDLSLGMSRILALETRDYLPADNLLRRWRDQNTLPDLGSYVVATRTTRAAIDAALDFAADAIRRRTTITELNAYAVYLKSMRDFAAAAMPGVQVRRTLTNFHSGSRTIFPANAAPYPIDATINTLKIDAGCLLFDADGFLLSCSDIARTLPLSEAAASLYAELQRCVRTVIRESQPEEAARQFIQTALMRSGAEARVSKPIRSSSILIRRVRTTPETLAICSAKTILPICVSRLVTKISLARA